MIRRLAQEAVGLALVAIVVVALAAVMAGVDALADYTNH